MPKPTAASLDLAYLSNEVVPFSPAEYRRAGIKFIENPDPILRHIAQRGIGAYRDMELAEPAVIIAKNARVSTSLAYPLKMRPADRSSDARDLYDFALALWNRILRRDEIRALIHCGRYWGWRPLEAIQELDDWDWKGRPVWGPREILEKPPEEFRFTVDRKLAYTGAGYLPRDPIVFDRPEDELKWIIATSGSTNIPYGDAIYRPGFIVHHVKQQFFRSWATGVDRSVGVVKATPTQPPTGAEAIKGIERIAGEVADAVKGLEKKRVLVEPYGWTLDLLTNIGANAAAWKDPIGYCDQILTLLILGEDGTTRVGESGSLSAREVLERRGDNFCKTDSSWEESVWNDQVISRSIRANFGPGSEDRYPKLVSTIHRPLTADNVVKVFALGGELDGGEISTELGVPLADPDDPDAIVWKKQAPPPAIIAAAPGQNPTKPIGAKPEEEEDPDTAKQPEATQPPKPPKPGKPNPARSIPAPLAAAAEEQGKRVGVEVEAALSEATDAANRYVASLTNEFLREHPRPFTAPRGR